MLNHRLSRRKFLSTTAATAAGTCFLNAQKKEPIILGQGNHKYRVVDGWGILGKEAPVNNCHGIVEDQNENIILLTDHPDCSVIIYDKKGKLLSQWKGEFKQAHGLTIVTEGLREVLFISDTKGNAVYKTTMDGEVLNLWKWPASSGKYQREQQYKPSWTLHAPNGSFYILDGYGKDYIQHIDKTGKLLNIFGGQEAGINHWGPHGGIYDNGLLIAMSDQQYLLKLDEAGKEMARYLLPGGNPRQIQRVGDYYYVAHLADNWPADRNSRGFVSILDKNFKVVSNLGGTPPKYSQKGELEKMAHQGTTFKHPHDLVVAKDESIYVAQFASGNTYPIKLERV